MTTNETPRHYWSHADCGGRGTNPACKKAAKTGRTWHVSPGITDNIGGQHLVMPNHHYFTEAEGVAAIEAALEHAPTVRTDEDLYAYREAGTAYKLNKGWIDPTRRGTPEEINRKSGFIR